MVSVLLHVRNCHIENLILFSLVLKSFITLNAQSRIENFLFVRRVSAEVFFSVRNNKDSFLTFIDINGLSAMGHLTRRCGC